MLGEIEFDTIRYELARNFNKVLYNLMQRSTHKNVFYFLDWGEVWHPKRVKLVRKQKNQMEMSIH